MVMRMELINKDFIIKWEKNYDIHENDEVEYEYIVEKVGLEVRENNCISKDTFSRILNWKSPRLKGIVKINKFDELYSPIIKECNELTSHNEKIKKIISLHGIAIPTGTTILHFMYPSIFPIMDIHTAETLYFLGYLDSKSRTEKNYYNFLNTLNQIKNKTSFSLREIDRALFSYHKNITSNLSYNNSSTNSNNNKIYGISKRKSSKYICLDNLISEYYNMTNIELMAKLSEKYIHEKKQKDIFLKEGVWTKVRLNYIAGLILTKRGFREFSPKEIREIIREEIIPSTDAISDSILAGLILTQDVHVDAKEEYNNGYPCLKKVEHGKYIFIGFEEQTR
jgi:hypothetical protein